VRNFDRAREVDHVALTILREHGNDAAVSIMLVNTVFVLMQAGDLDQAAEWADDAIAATLRVGEPRQIARAYLNASAVADFRHEVERAQELGHAAIPYGREAGDPSILTILYLNEGRFLHQTNRVAEARDAFETAIEEARACGDDRMLGYGLCDLARLESGGDTKSVDGWLAEASEIHDRIENEEFTSFFLQTDALCAIRGGHRGPALRSARAKLRHMRDTDVAAMSWSVFETMGEIASDLDRPELAAWCLGVATGLAKTFDNGGRLTPWEATRRERVRDAAVAAIGTDAVRRAEEAGEQTAWQDAVAKALRESAAWLD
jgi:tetratricopeptide (TPR) repeat protein